MHGSQPELRSSSTYKRFPCLLADYWAICSTTVKECALACCNVGNLAKLNSPRLYLILKPLSFLFCKVYGYTEYVILESNWPASIVGFLFSTTNAFLLSFATAWWQRRIVCGGLGNMILMSMCVWKLKQNDGLFSNGIVQFESGFMDCLSWPMRIRRTQVSQVNLSASGVVSNTVQCLIMQYLLIQGARQLRTPQLVVHVIETSAVTI